MFIHLGDSFDYDFTETSQSFKGLFKECLGYSRAT
jgi:hypothetical protein